MSKKQIKSKKKEKEKTKHKQTLTGVFDLTRKGFGFVTPDNSPGAQDIFISSDDTEGAWSGDLVQIELKPGKRGIRPEGIVRKIIRRNVTEVVGTFEKCRNYGFVVSDNQKVIRSIYIPRENVNKAKDGDKVVAAIEEYGSRHQSPTGNITEILGHKDEAGIDIFSIARSMNIPMEFPLKAANQAARCQDHVIEGDFAGREDLRDWQLVTIDGPDAKDLDDAVSLTEDEVGYVLGVHIADVSNYVQEGSALDREALKRGTSVYLADRVIPMLPFQLSNGICSLNAGEDRLALSVIMRLTKRGKVTAYRIVESVIRVGERMSYPDVAAILENHDETLVERYRDYVPMFERMRRLSNQIRGRRKRRGAVDFDFPEAKVILNEQGVPVDIKAEEANCATRMIEDFMLTANETVAEEFLKMKVPFVYRVHENPDPDKIEQMLMFVRKRGVNVEKKHQKITPRELQTALNSIKGKTVEPLISRVILRSMSRARYSPECLGHFGLAAKYYCHFTSPIRRYPDLQIHRIIHDVIRGRMSEERIRHYREILGDVSDRCSQTERRADEVERETVKLKEAQYMSFHIGEEFEGIISSVTAWGMYVELPNTIEGLVPMAKMNEDYFEFDDENYSLVGRLSGAAYSMGSPVRVRAASADPVMRTIEFELA